MKASRHSLYKMAVREEQTQVMQVDAKLSTVQHFRGPFQKSESISIY